MFHPMLQKKIRSSWRFTAVEKSGAFHDTLCHEENLWHLYNAQQSIRSYIKAEIGPHFCYSILRN